MRYGIGLVMVIVLMVGLGFSYRDWKAWRYEETKNFGFGPGELYSPTEPFTEHFINQFVGVKFNYPEGWKAIPSSKLPVVNKEKTMTLGSFIGNSKTEVVIFERSTPEEPYFLVILSVAMNLKQENLVDIVNSNIDKKMKNGFPIVGERRYINSDRANWTVVDFDLEGMRHMMAYTNFGEKLFEIEFIYPIDDNYKKLKTFEELVTNMILI